MELTVSMGIAPLVALAMPPMPTPRPGTTTPPQSIVHVMALGYNEDPAPRLAVLTPPTQF